MVVVGGGNVAFDVARSSIRNGAKKVTMVCLESRDEQTADEFEIEDGMEEGITIINRVAPISVERDANGQVCGLKVQQISSLFDSMGERIYSGGDCAFGPALFITAIRHGQEAARTIDSDLRGTAPYQEFVGEFTELSPMRDKTYLRTRWALPKMQAPNKRVKNIDMVEYNYTDEEAHQQSNRCLQCHVSPVFDGYLCIKCNGCVDVCPCSCLKLVPITKMNLDIGEGNLRAAVDNFYGVDSYSMTEDELIQMGSAMLKDEDLCIRCGLCAEKCPTQAVTMDAMNYSFRWLG
jgi:NADPH-dependent glutamate synthase beta subunit-like oxidoreductase